MDHGKGYEEKKRIRQYYKNRRSALTAMQVREKSEQICRRLLASAWYREAEVLYFYYPLGNEVNLLQAAQAALDDGKIVAFPKTLQEGIAFYQVEDLTAFAEGAFHVMEPCSDRRLTEGAPLILTPGVAFDKTGGRMGYGGGYYDRYGARCPGAVRIGIAYECQLAEKLPLEPHDIPMEAVITETNIYECR